MFNSVDFLWANPPPHQTTTTFFFLFYICERHSKETLKLLISQEQRLTDQLPHSKHTHTPCFLIQKKKDLVRDWGGKDNTIDLNIPHITKAWESRDMRFMYVVETFVV